LRKLDIARDRNVVAAQIRMTTPKGAPDKSVSIAGCTSASSPTSATPTLSFFMIFPRNPGILPKPIINLLGGHGAAFTDDLTLIVWRAMSGNRRIGTELI
jgi:hypothetical protein